MRAVRLNMDGWKLVEEKTFGALLVARSCEGVRGGNGGGRGAKMETAKYEPAKGLSE
mgnify:CR=1 FL=1